MTSADANKILRELNNELTLILERERGSSTFQASVGEDVESCRHDYDFAATQKSIDSVEKDIRELKHKINVFNTTYVLDGFDITIDQALILLPQLTSKKRKYEEMVTKMEKERCHSYNNVVDYRYLNYDIREVHRYLQKTTELLTGLQRELDIVNNTVDM